MEHFPQTWLPIISKHLRKHLGLSGDMPLPESVQTALGRLRAAEIARLTFGAANTPVSAPSAIGAWRSAQHGTAFALAVTCLPSVELCHHAFEIGTLGNAVAMAAMR